MNDLERARAHLKQAEQGGDAGDAAAEATIALAYSNLALADRLGLVIDHLVKPLRFTTPTHPTSAQDAAWWQRQQEAAVERRDPEAIRRTTDALNRVRVAEHYADSNPEASAQRARDLDGTEPTAPTGGVFGQMEDRPNDLDDLEKH